MQQRVRASLFVDERDGEGTILFVLSAEACVMLGGSNVLALVCWAGVVMVLGACCLLGTDVGFPEVCDVVMVWRLSVGRVL